MNKKGVSLISLIIAIIVIIIIAASVLLNSESSIDNAYESMFYSELARVQDTVTLKRNENMIQGDPNIGFQMLKVNNVPSDFVSAKSDATGSFYGYLVNLEALGMRDCEWGLDYPKFMGPDAEVTFKIDDVYVFDGNGSVYYLMGFTNDEESNDRVHSMETENAYRNPVIGSVTYLIHSDMSKAMISIEAYSGTDSKITVTVGGEVAGYQDENKFYIEKTRNGTYDVVARDGYGNKATTKINIQGILEPGDTANVTIPEIISLEFKEQQNGKRQLVGEAIDPDDGLVAYAFTLGEGIPASGWVTINNTTEVYTATYDARETGTYYFWVKNSKNVASSSSVSVEISDEMYNITYNLNGGNWEDNLPKAQQKMNDETINLITDRPFRVGYSFAGWSTSVNSESAEYQPGAEYSEEKDLILFAVWTPRKNTKYTVQHYKENIDGTYSLEETEELEGATDAEIRAIAKNYPSFSEYTLHPETQNFGKILSDGTLVLKIYYARNLYQVTLNGTQSSPIGAGNYKAGSTVSIKANPIDGYTFSNWEIESGTISNLTLNSAETSFIMPDENVVINEIDVPTIYKISYELDGGKANPENPLRYTMRESITLNNPTKDGYRFKGWKGTDVPELSKNVTFSNGKGDRSYNAYYDELFELSFVSDVPSYTSTQIKVTSIDNVEYEYSIDGGVTWTNCEALTTESAGVYVTYIEVFDNITLKVRAMKADGTPEYTKEITITNILNDTIANAPILGDGMKVVYWNGSTEQEADTFTTDMYSYTSKSQTAGISNSNWANAKTEDGSYWVWIPRFAYKIQYYQNEARTISSNVKTDYERIFIIFLKGTSSSQYQHKDSDSIEVLPDDYIIPNGFTKEGKQLAGFWISKYEISANNATSLLGGGNVLTTNAGNIDILNALSIPNKQSWRGISYNNAYTNSLKMYEAYNSELISNKEWETTVILSHSTYGVNITKITENSGYTTASGGSSNGNQTGVYDLVGGAWEYVQNDSYDTDIKLLDYFDENRINNKKLFNEIGQIVRGTGRPNNSNANLPLNGDADVRIGYRVVLHI